MKNKGTKGRITVQPKKKINNQKNDVTLSQLPSLDMVSEIIPDAIISINNKGNIIFWNPFAEKLFGFSKAEIIEKNITVLMPKHFRADHTKGLSNYLKTGKPKLIGHTTEFSGLKKSGEEFPIELTLIAWKENDEHFFTGIIRDITSHNKIIADLRLVNQLSTRISEKIEIEDILKTSLRDMLEILEIKHGCIYEVVESGKLVMRVQKNLSAKFLEEKREVLLGDGCAGGAAVNQSFYAPRKSERNFVCADTERILGLDCLAAVPIVSKGITHGVIEFFAPVHRRLTPRERQLIKSITNQLAIALENAYLYRFQKDTANILQEAILRVPEKIKGVDFEHIYFSSMTEQAMAGGDFYDIFQLDKNNVGFLIGDVSGKGIEAATFTSFVKNTIKAYMFQKSGPCTSMTLANNVISKGMDPLSFVSVFLGVLNTTTKEVTYCNAGHPPPIIKKKGLSYFLGAFNPVLGAIDDYEYVNTKVRFGSTDTLVLYTDGVTEARTGTEFYGEERLIDFINDLKNMKGLPGQILDEINMFSNDSLLDDVAILTIKAS